MKAVNNRKLALAVERNYFSALELLIPNYELEIVRGVLSFIRMCWRDWRRFRGITNFDASIANAC